jgi:hypothetical protein
MFSCIASITDLTVTVIFFVGIFLLVYLEGEGSDVRFQEEHLTILNLIGNKMVDLFWHAAVVTPQICFNIPDRDVLP